MSIDDLLRGLFENRPSLQGQGGWLFDDVADIVIIVAFGIVGWFFTFGRNKARERTQRNQQAAQDQALERPHTMGLSDMLDSACPACPSASEITSTKSIAELEELMETLERNLRGNLSLSKQTQAPPSLLGAVVTAYTKHGD